LTINAAEFFYNQKAFSLINFDFDIKTRFDI